MNSIQWKKFKRYGIEHLWECETNGWISALYDSKWISIITMFPRLTNFIKKRYRDYYKFRFKITHKPVIPILEYVVTTKCTMSCKHCNTLVPYFTNDTHLKPMKFETFKDDIDKLLLAVDYVQLLGFVGGEPLLNKDLAKMIEYASKQKKIKHVFVPTNCTIIPNEELIRVFKHNKVGIQISNYTNVKNIKGGIKVKHDEVKDLLLKNNIHISNPHEPSNSKNWQTMPKIYPDLQKDEKKIIKNFKTCFGQYCYMFSDGLILQCTVCIYIVKNLKLLDSVKEEIIDVRNSNNTKLLTEKLIDFVSKPYSQFCHYCHFVDMQYGLPCGEQV